ncbi:phospholipase effector Tle1 domain-containing protein [Candidatus Pantoea formicae]|uniref:phospholipase effector Tle1 domain-containing protein n=1 Tax=Candidatus Pantoea formicae TaxID=2608355 RepID=UPI003ED93B12
MTLPDQNSELFLQGSLNFCTIRIGVFFDGTGQNGNKLDGTSDELFGATNIYRLFKMYGVPDNQTQWMMYGKLYVEGIGTLNNQSDCIYSLATGDEDFGGCEGYGPDSKLKSCVEKITSELDRILSQGEVVFRSVSVEFDVFGYSRGAILARHLTNTLYENDASVCDKIRLVVNLYGHELIGVPVVNYLGLFDTVGTFMDKTVFSNDPHDTGYTRGLKVKVPAGAARQAFQLNAFHEFRYNYPLHSLSGIYPELTIAGSHADVGGGSPHMIQEHVDVSAKNWWPWHTAQFWVERELLSTLLSKKWRPLKGEITYRGSKWLHYIATNHRLVRGHLQFVSLLAMLKVAEKSGCSFDPGYKKFEELIPDDLNDYCGKVISAALNTLDGKPETLEHRLIDQVTPDYVHLSASWVTLAELYGDMRLNKQMMRTGENQHEEKEVVIDLNVMNNFWPDRPDENWERKIFD